MATQKEMPPRAAALRNLQEIPGVGPSIAHDLWRLGVGSVSDLKGADPQKLYDRLCDLKKAKIDRCALYVFREAVYYASRKKHDPELLKWWNWQDSGKASGTSPKISQGKRLPRRVSREGSPKATPKR